MDAKKTITDDRLVLDEGSGESVHVAPNAFAEFEASVDAALATLVARWESLASPAARKGATTWRRS